GPKTRAPHKAEGSRRPASASRLPPSVLKGAGVRVVHVYKDIYPVKGGMENYVLALCRRLRETAGVDAQILATSPGRQTERTTIEGVPTVKAARLATAASTPL